MATGLEEYVAEEIIIRAFLWAKGLNAKGIHKEMFPVHGVKCLSLNAIHNWVGNISLTTKRLKRRLRKWLRRHGFRRTGKGMGEVYQCWWRICRDITVFFFTFE
jgi:hypothetical protein